MQHQDPETYAVIGAAMEVHRELGHGFLEAVYHEALALELEFRHIPFQREEPLKIKYKDRLLNTGYRVDFICQDSILVELKAVSNLGKIDEAQALNYLKASPLEKALLINFGESSLRYKRLIK